MEIRKLALHEGAEKGLLTNWIGVTCWLQQLFASSPLILSVSLSCSSVSRHYMVKKLSVEFKELLTAKALGHFMDNIVCRAFSLGPNLPIIKMIQVENAKTASNGAQIEVINCLALEMYEVCTSYQWFSSKLYNGNLKKFVRWLVLLIDRLVINLLVCNCIWTVHRLIGPLMISGAGPPRWLGLPLSRWFRAGSRYRPRFSPIYFSMHSSDVSQGKSENQTHHNSLLPLVFRLCRRARSRLQSKFAP